MGNNIDFNQKLRMTQGQKFKCAYCGSEMKWDEITVDHIIPTAKGGSNKKENKTLCCETCNSAKASLSVEEFEFLVANLHKIMRGNLYWRLFCKHYKITIKRKSNFIEKFRKKA